jgi:hypothetical protein
VKKVKLQVCNRQTCSSNLSVASDDFEKMVDKVAGIEKQLCIYDPGVIYFQSLKHPLTRPLRASYSRLAKIARVLVRLDHVAGFIVNADHSAM